jgi:phosphoribosylaminoimidazole-succinocarboxamide synthase
MMNLGTPSAEGKTKQVFGGLCIMRGKDDITAGDGAKHDLMAGKAVWANETTCNVFRYLATRGLGRKLAFITQHDERSFLAHQCEMLPFEVVVRGKKYGSYLKRHPRAVKGSSFSAPIVEFYLKTSGKKWNGIGRTVHKLPVDDPLIIFEKKINRVYLYHPGVPLAGQQPFLELPMRGYLIEHLDAWLQIHRMRSVAREAFRHLCIAWETLGGDLVDMKVEFGIPIADSRQRKQRILLADVIDNDSWRVLFENEHLDKQLYRDGKSLDVVAAKYKRVAELTAQFI